MSSAAAIAATSRIVRLIFLQFPSSLERKGPTSERGKAPPSRSAQHLYHAPESAGAHRPNE